MSEANTILLSKPVRLNMTNQLSVNFFIRIESMGKDRLIDRNLYLYRPGSKILSKCTNVPLGIHIFKRNLKSEALFVDRNLNIYLYERRYGQETDSSIGIWSSIGMGGIKYV